MFIKGILILSTSALVGFFQPDAFAASDTISQCEATAYSDGTQTIAKVTTCVTRRK